MIRPISIAALLMAVAFAQAGQTSAALKTQFQAKYDLFVKAYAGKDVKTVAKFLADDFNGGNKDRPITRQHTLDVLKTSKSPFKTKYRKVISVVVNGDLASVMEDSVTAGLLPDKKTKKVHQFEIRMRSLDTWERHGGVWQIRQLRPIKTMTLEDGRAFRGDPNH